MKEGGTMEKERELEELLVLAKQGDQEAQLAIVTAFRPLVRKLAAQERDYSRRTDLASQLVLGLLEAIRKYPGEDARKFPGFVKTHLTYLLSHYIRKEVRWNKLKEKLYDQTQESCYTEDFTLRIQRRELQDALRCLTPAEQRLVYLAVGQRIPWKALGRTFQSPVSTLYGRYKRALGKVKERVKSGSAAFPSHAKGDHLL